MKKSFTLIELIVVIAIIAILAAIIAPNAFKVIEKANRSATIADFRTIKTASMAFYADTGNWPVDDCEEALLKNQNNTTVCADINGGGISGWDGPYIEMWPAKTRWGGVYNLTNDVGVNWSIMDATGSFNPPSSRYITINSTPLETIKKLDIQIDGESSNATCVADGPGRACGQHRWNATSYSQYMLISTESSVFN
ncbi:MAG: prepilin-type N-terminal cleavage/methylation domain-containing protein [Candidatus Omnitrophica bacterium]|nr:prepilin-type N-terminal cleavage/methylation domain-containing protein [Candidatus Omnitrophota bacterium]MBU2251663.1 prepilin-type N-terminal cleavage/methylation domain-containing protein [Candidatus Omnitrophota bacterium]MBU2473902.1 prepilin-type N-terminal cleavage/methylation domain-containing protein [Candidatus Omnitrophota bacterium]